MCLEHSVKFVSDIKKSKIIKKSGFRGFFLIEKLELNSHTKVYMCLTRNYFENENYLINDFELFYELFSF